tara:strand:+ start:3586 stop:3828 length:243 start_codon:yes stop_codon:yes gene_type:complete
MFYHEAIESILTNEKESLETMKEGELKITQPCICKSEAGFYIGEWCIEKTGNNLLLPQPYQRLSGYMSESDAVEQLPHYL